MSKKLKQSVQVLEEYELTLLNNLKLLSRRQDVALGADDELARNLALSDVGRLTRTVSAQAAPYMRMIAKVDETTDDTTEVKGKALVKQMRQALRRRHEESAQLAEEAAAQRATETSANGDGGPGGTLPN